MDPIEFKAVVKVAGKECGQVEALSYTDEADGSSDSVSVTLSDISGKWHGENMPQKAETIHAKIKRMGGGEKAKIFNCGIFQLDDIEIQGYPSTATFGAVSDPVSEAFKTTKRTRTWKHTNLRQIAMDISKKYAKLKIVYDGPTVPIASAEQNKQPDSTFLKSMAEKYGFGVKVCFNKIVLYNIEQYENKKAVKTLTPKQIEPGWTWRTSINEKYTGVKLSYKNSSGKKIETKHGTNKRLLILSEKVENKADAIRVALARVNKENENVTKMSFTLRNPMFLAATSCIQLNGFGALNGKYFITRVSHTLSSGYKVKVECRKIGKRIR